MAVGLLTIIYPSVAVRHTQPEEMVRSRMLLTRSGGIKYRNFLILIQFVFLFTLGLSAWFMNRQIQYMDHKDKGFDPTNVIKVGNAFDIGSIDDYQVFKSKLLSHPEIEGVAFGPMMGDGMAPLTYKPEGYDAILENLLSYGVDIDYFDVMGIDIREGEFKNILQTAENGKIVSLVNESFINKFGWEEEPIGKKIILRPDTENELHRKVSAVFEDFHFYSLKERITPQIISLRPDPQFVNTNILVKVNGSPEEALKIVEAGWNELQPSLPIEMSFMDDAVKKMYTKEKQTSRVGLALSILAIVLSFTGIIGFMTYIIGLKSKEIAIRKVLGASILQIINILNRQIVYIVLFASAVGLGMSYSLMKAWLQDYAYSISLNPLAFLFATLLVYAILIGIITSQTFKSAQSNPILALKDE